MAFNIQEIRSQLVLGGARASLFQVQIANPANGAGDIKVPFMVKAAQLPASTLGSFDVPYFGRKIKIAGDRTFAEWTVTIINDEDFLIRNAMEQWMNSINSHAGNIREFGSASPLLYKSNAQITQFSKTGVPIREYTFNGMFPTEVSAIEMSWETTDAIEDFTVTFQYDFWEVSGGVTGNSTA
tara:strand:+ start:629 stop:1177 length:549 start_codon:yes stop_codon:yes gene_type:complete